jgi:hypothetical protein
VAAGSEPVIDTPLTSVAALLLTFASALLLATAEAPLLDGTASARVLSGLPTEVCSSPPLDVVAELTSTVVDWGRAAPVLLRTPPSPIDGAADAALVPLASEPSADVVNASLCLTLPLVVVLSPVDAGSSTRLLFDSNGPGSVLLVSAESMPCLLVDCTAEDLIGFAKLKFVDIKYDFGEVATAVVVVPEGPSGVNVAPA